jgi:hypothetical protein
MHFAPKPMCLGPDTNAAPIRTEGGNQCDALPTESSDVGPLHWTFRAGTKPGTNLRRSGATQAPENGMRKGKHP